MSVVRAYTRLSYKEADIEKWVDNVLKFGVHKRNIFVDKASGKLFKRPKYDKMITALCPGDLVYVQRLDDLGRSYADIMQQWKLITEEKQADIVVMDMPALDTRKGKDESENPVTDIVLSMLDFFREKENRLDTVRQAEGIAAAKRKGVVLGAPKHPETEEFVDAYLMWKDGFYTLREAADVCRLPKSTFYDMAKRYEAKQQAEKG